MARARRRFGQHFLEAPWVAKLVEAIDASAGDCVVEIGPGRGAITRPLAARVARLLAIEIDRDLAAALRAEALPGVTVIERDVLDVDLAAVVAEWHRAAGDGPRPVRLVGNLPYNISTPILFKVLGYASSGGGVRDATLMLQREVADRLLARPETRAYGVLSILTALHADASRLLALPPGAFRPRPRVSSAVVRLTFRAPAVGSDLGVLTALVRSIFTRRRKTLTNALEVFARSYGLEAAFALSAAGIDGRRRPETLQLVELARLADVFASAEPVL